MGAAQAQVTPRCSGVLAYMPLGATSAVPSLGAWSLLALALGLGLVAARRLHRGSGPGGRAALLGLALVLAAGSGGPWATRAWAVVADLASPAGGAVILDNRNTTLTNTTDVVLTLSSLSIGSGQIDPDSTTCQSGQLLAPGESCVVRLLACRSVGDGTNTN
jgi:hypothetical protein